jgi:hypothetical protein
MLAMQKIEGNPARSVVALFEDCSVSGGAPCIAEF